MTKVALVGHCVPDNTYLQLAVRRADAQVDAVVVDDEHELERALADGPCLLLINRQLPFGFHESLGVDLIKRLRGKSPNLKMILISNYPEAQSEAIEAGALPGFGKRELNTPKVANLLREALL